VIEGNKMTDRKDKLQTESFGEILRIIENAKLNAYRAVNKELIEMHWAIGRYISKKVKAGVWGKGIVDEIAEFIQQHNPGTSGFSARNLWRMKQFYEVYEDNEILSTLSRELSWSINSKIMSSKTKEEREFYMRSAIENNYSYRELERQMDSSLYERTKLSKGSGTNALVRYGYGGLTALRDNYVLEFLDMPKDFKEKDLRKAIVSNLKEFLLEFGKDFSFIGEEYRVQVGNTDFFIDLLFYYRELKCMVAVELKVGPFKPEHIGQMQFYLEALDRDVKKEDENPSVGLIMCANKDDTVVEYALSKSLAPSMVAQYELALPDKRLLQQRVMELALLADDVRENDQE